MIFRNMQGQLDATLPPRSLLVMVAVFLGLFLTFPFFIGAARGTIHSSIFGDKPASFGIHVAESLALLAAITLTAVVLENPIFVLSLAGALPGTFMVYVFPGMLMLMLTRGQSIFSRHRFVPLVLMSSGILVSGVVTGLVIYQYIMPDSCPEEAENFKLPLLYPENGVSMSKTTGSAAESSHYGDTGQSGQKSPDSIISEASDSEGSEGGDSFFSSPPENEFVVEAASTKKHAIHLEGVIKTEELGVSSTMFEI